MISTTIEIEYAKTHLSELIKRAQNGEEVILCESGTPLAMLVPYPVSKGPRKLGLWAGKIKIADDFDE
ncbi:MAG: type II toxin-antitoxin system Phd/YefM family antitoxin [Gammaproteobacteria bacterium]